MLPLGLLTAAQGHPMLVELKNGETLNGHLVTCDTWMNLTLKEVVQTSPDGDKFYRLPEVYVKGNNSRSNSKDSRTVDTEEAEEGREETMVVEVETEDEVGEVEAGEGAEEEVLEG
ncbi:putative U6 snRNA-associated Sm-like protein LSm4 [Glarea lozoyensis 74030]|uniref:LSM complex subunit LSM4 n=1 Tax=Glarea lozoyensis (strain ATCC 74030 / MF5533) TaxID=1104152 RepID=H0EPJ3_GLAL7|nr:putative U6 snRNA-associated Sm-like protein LSm4 [Glarea lozoyensis 74030]